MFRKKTFGDIIFDILNYLFMIVMVVITLYPIWYVAICSLSNSDMLVGQKGIMLWPAGFSLDAYKAVFKNPSILSGYKVTIFVTVVGTALNILMTALGAYAVSRKDFAIKKIMLIMIIITMYFGGGMIPTYLVIYKILNLGNNILALILPGAIGAYNMLVLRASFLALPTSVEESAKIDGANDFVLLFKIVLPLCMPTVAVLILFYGVDRWNSWFGAMLYMRDRSKYPLQLILREILLMNSMDNMLGSSSGGTGDQYSIAESIKYATIMVATVPILLVYPYIQKYFVKGVMLGAVKG